MESIERKHDYSRGLARLPYLAKSNILKETRQREEEVAVYNAGVFAEYMTLCGDAKELAGLARRLARLANNDNDRVGKIIAEALIKKIRDLNNDETLVRAVIKAGQALRKRAPALEDLISACRNIPDGG